MPELIEDVEVPTLGASRIGIGVKKGGNGLRTLKWALEKEVPANGIVYLIHVQPSVTWVPNALGSKFPVEQVHPEMVKRYKYQILSEAQSLFDQYRAVCDKKKIQSRVCYSESDSVQKELVSHVSRFGITKLILGVSSRSVLSRALKKDSISTYVAKNSPGFCTVMVVNKGKLCHVKHATIAPVVHCSSFPSSENDSRMSVVSETITESDDAFEGFADDSRTSIDMQDGEKSMVSGVSEDISNTQMASVDYLQTTSQWVLTYGKGNDEACQSPPVGVMIREIPDDDNNGVLNDTCKSQTTLPSETTLLEDELLDSDSMLAQEFGRIYTVSERRQDPDLDMVEDLESSFTSETTIRPVMQLIHKNCPMGSSFTASNSAVGTAPEVEMLQDQLIQARLCAWRAQKEAEWQRNKLEAVLASAKKKVMEHERHRVEALRKAKCAMQQAAKDTLRYREALAALEVALRDHEEVNKRIQEEVARHQETQMELALQKRMLDVSVCEAACAKDRAEAERRRFEETLMKLDDMSRKVEEEYQLRREAEEKASQEAMARRAALAALGKQQGYSEYSFQELQTATNDFSEENKLGECAYGLIYKGKLRHSTVAIKVPAQGRTHGWQQFQKEVELLSYIRHPHILMLLGACPERRCIVYEHMANGSLEDRLYSKGGTPPLPWYTRFRICLEVASALLFLHSQPKPMVHFVLKLANILLDNHFVSKLGDVGLATVLPHDTTFSVTFYKESVPVKMLDYIDPDYQRTGVASCECDVYALGIIMLQLLTGRQANGVTHLVKEAERSGRLGKVLDNSAGDWPLEEATKLARLSLQCTTMRRERAKLDVDVLPVLESIQAVAGVAAANMACASSSISPIIPSFFFCPIDKEIMKDPCVAADGYTYEYDAIKVWLQANNTSPMTNLRLDNKTLTPNFTLRAAIKEWYDSGFLGELT